MKKLILCMSMMATMASAQDVFLRGNIVMTTTQLEPQGNDVYRGEVTLDDSDVFLFSDKYVYFECPSTGYKSGNIRINGGQYTATFNLATKAWTFEAPTDEYRISAFGSSVCNGQGATDFKGYAYLYGQQLKERSDQGLSDHPFYVSGISIGGNNTQNLLDRYDELTRNYSRYVIIGLSLGNEGIHESTNKQQTLNQFSTNMQKIIQKINADGKVPVVMNNYTRGDFTLDDYSYVKQMNLLIHQWDVASVNTLGAIDDGTGKWATGYQQDNAHPTTAGHREFLYAIPPSLFDALESGKPQPVRDMSRQMVLEGGNNLQFQGEGTVHPFTISLRVKGNGAGRVLKFGQSYAAAFATVTVSDDAHVVYTSANGQQLTSTATLDANDWHTVTLTHYFAQGRTLLYVDTEPAGELREQIELGRVMVGDVSAAVSRQLSELMFWRSAFSPEEVDATVSGQLLKSSLELYVPTSDATSLVNLAMTQNEVTATTDDLNDAGQSAKLSSPYEGVSVQAGEEFYLYNVETGFDVELKANGSGWQINPQFGHNQSMNGTNWYLDTSDAVTAWTFEPVEVEGVTNAYHIKYNGDWLHASPAPDYKLTRDALPSLATWQIVSRQQRMDYALQATAEEPRDLSFLIRGNEFTHEDTRKADYWTLTDNDNGGSNWNSGRFEPDNRQNSVFEAWNMTHMDFYQVIPNLPAGRYEVQVQAAYSPTDGANMNRNDLDAYNNRTLDIHGYLYANQKQVELPTVYTMQYAARTGHYAAKDLGGIWIIDGVNQFSYTVANNPDAFKVVLPVAFESDGDLRLGIRVMDAPAKTAWVQADKFRLRYIGKPDISNGIQMVTDADNNGGDQLYDLMGRRLTVPQHPGIYIRQGKKVFVR